MEPRAAVGEYDAGDDQYTLWTTSQNPHVIRLLMGAFVLGIPEHKLRVVAPDVGGGFGSKIFHYAEEAFVTFAAKAVGRPVKWTSTRSEAFMSDAHGRDHVTKIELALDDDGRFLALRTDTLANMGAYLSTFAPCTPTYLHGTLMAGNYATPLIYVNVKAVFTNTVPVDAYRGAGRPEATFRSSGSIDKAARELGIDPVEIRRRNFVKPDQFPYQTPVAVQLRHRRLPRDDGRARAHRRPRRLRRGARPRARDAASCAASGSPTYIEACGIAPSSLVGALGARAGLYESATVRVNATGVDLGLHRQPQPRPGARDDLRRRWSSSLLGIDAGQIDIVHGDTARVPFGMGTYGSRSLAVGGSAIVKATEKVIAKAKKIAAHLIEASDTDIEFKDGKFSVAGTDKSLAWTDVTLAAYVPHKYPIEELEPGLEETAFYDPANFTFPAGAYGCEVEVDPETGEVEVMGFAAADDFGNIVNPMIVEGQVHGGLAQGIGQALLRAGGLRRRRPAPRRLLHGLRDAAGGRRAELRRRPFVRDALHPQPARGEGLRRGRRDRLAAGAGQRGARRAERRRDPVEHIDMPLTPSRVWAAIQAAR